MAFDSRSARVPRVYTLGLIVEAPVEAVSKNGKAYRYAVCQLLDGSRQRVLLRDSYSPALCDYVCVAVSPHGEDFGYTAYALRPAAGEFVENAALYVSQSKLSAK